MRKLLLLALIALSFLANPVFADNDPYQDWIWINGFWIYTGDDPVPPLPPPIKG